MNFSQELTNLNQKLQDQIPEDSQAKMQQAKSELEKAHITEHSLQEGDTVPNFTLPNATGNTVQLQTLLQNGPVVLSFYRGQWCPYCNLELRALQNTLPDIQKFGASLATISPQTPDNSLSTKEKYNLDFEVLSDVGNQVARKFGLVFQVPEYLCPVYDRLGIDLAAHNGDESFELPMPATYVVNTNGKIALAFVEADYTKRLEPDQILATLRNLKVTV
ncbi:peroxiredoxin-like family protein [Geitlerinema sp. PCC 9228]|jgi:peroxiredoxin|uniref:peroxiredoxin-like family protein n=1 Tax=Geitlerinema sp. PCC 9228 TaxID=111611 RepID=UPI0008F9BD0E|nr:peroxiredoxin-like family protein [Geitlerinema sp. PCC 9228]